MHACGHDTHVTTWIGTARQLVARKAEWSGTLVMIAQPGEETGEGAKAMLDDGLYTRFPKPTHAIAFHDSAALPAGTIGYSNGFALANVGSAFVWAAAHLLPAIALGRGLQVAHAANARFAILAGFGAAVALLA